MTDVIQRPVTLQRIRASAAALFRQKGYAPTTMRDVSEAVGLSKAGLYHHYESKELLLLDIAESGTALLLDQLRAVERLDADPTQKLEAFVRGRMETIAANQDILAVIWQERPAIGTEAFANVADRLRQYRAGVVDLIAAAQRSGAIDPDVDPHLLMLAIDGMTGWSYLWFRSDGSYSSTTIGTSFWNYLLSGVSGKR